MKNWNSSLLVALSFIMGCTLTLFFVSVDDDEISRDVYSISNFGPEIDYENTKHKLTLLIIIITSPDNFSRRNTIRETWLRLAKNDQSVKHLFVTGTKCLSPEKEQLLARELLQNDDIIILNTICDSYAALSKKLLSTFVYIMKEYSFKFVLKCDDDSFVQVPEVMKELKTKFYHSKLLYWGFFDGRASVKRIGKWKEPDWFLCSHFLPYALGGGYILSHNLVKYISRNSELLSIYRNEDVSLGVWLSPLNITRVHDSRFDTEFVSRGCLNNYLITHKKSELDMRNFYSEIISNGRLCSKEKQIRPSYDYNWKVPTYHCCERNYSSLH